MPWLLLAGAALGLALSAAGLLESGGADHGSAAAGLAADQAARVGERVIRRVDYERMLAGVERDLRNPIDDATRRRVLERMIDEELLVQQALALDLAAADRRMRGELVSGLVDSLVAEADAAPPSEAEVEAHYRANREFFARPGRLRVESLFFARRASGSATAADELRARVEAARRRLEAGDAREVVEAALGDRRIAAVPDALLPLAKLRDYLGPGAVEALAGLEPAKWSAPIEAADGVLLVRIAEQEATQTPPFEEVEALVRRDLVRQRGDAALRRYLDGLRERTRIERNEAIFAAP
jgi:parvulin-like peptidyl-prolyl isomerase